MRPIAVSKQQALQDWLRFLTAEGHVLREHPELLFQLAANGADASNPGRAAADAWASRTITRPWLKWINKPHHPSPCLLTLMPATSGFESAPSPEFRVPHFALAPDGRHIASAAAGGPIQIWDARSGREVARLAHDGVAVLSLAWSPTGDRIAAGIAIANRTTPAFPHGRLALWTIPDRKELLRLDGDATNLKTCAFSADGSRIAVGYGAAEFPGIPGGLKVFDAMSGALVFERADYRNEVRSCAYSRDGSRLALAWTDGFVDVLDALSGADLARIQTGKKTPAFAFSPDGDRIAYPAGERGDVVEIATMMGDRQAIVPGPPARRVWSCAFSPDGREIVLSTDTELHRWCVKDRILLARVPAAAAWRCAFFPDGRAIVTSGLHDGVLRVWAADLGNMSEPVDARGPVDSVARAPDGRSVVLAHDIDRDLGSQTTEWDESRVVKVVDTQTGLECSWTLTGRHPLYSPDSSRIAIIVGNRVQIHVAEDGGERLSLEHRDASSHFLHTSTFSPDGTRLVTAGDRLLKVWDTATGKLLATLAGHAEDVTTVAFSPDGRWLLSASRHDHTVRLWDPARGSQVRVLTDCWEALLAWLPDGRHFIGKLREKSRIPKPVDPLHDNPLRILHACSGQQVATLTASGQVTSCVVASDGRSVVGSWYNNPYSAGPAPNVGIWSLPAGDQTAVLNASVGSSVCAISPAGRWIACNSSDGYLRVWDSATTKEICKYPRAGTPLAVGPGGRWLMAGAQLLGLMGIELGTSTLTAVYLYRCNTRRWDDRPTAQCDGCGHRIAVGAAVLKAIEELPATAWSDPRLNSTCSHCGTAVRFNPWVVDGRKQSAAKLALVRDFVSAILKSADPFLTRRE